MSSLSSRVRPSHAAIRCAGALALVWVLSFVLYPVHLTALAAAVWIIATLALVPIGTTLTDRIVAFLLLAAAPAVLIAWFTPFVPWLVSAPVLTGLLGSLVALAWGLGWTSRPVTRLPDIVTIGLAALTAAFYWLPFASGGLVRAIAMISQSFDAPAHYFMWMRVWANHGYLLFNTLPDPDFWNWRVYPQGAQALLANIGSVLTGNSSPPTQIDQSIALFAVLTCLQAGALALVTAWSVDRLSRSSKKPSSRRVVIFQIVAVLLVAIGPGSAVTVHSLSLATGLVVMIPPMALAATAQRSPRLFGLLIGASLVAVAPIYPICVLIGVVLWPLYLWTSRRFWLASSRRRVHCGVLTVVVALLCAPIFVLLALRKLGHSWDSWGYFTPLHWSAYAGIAILLGLLIAFARGRLPRAVEYACWVAAVVLIALAVEGILQWSTAEQPSYYTLKMMYLGWMLAVIAVGAGLASVRTRRSSKPPALGHLIRSLFIGSTVGFLVCGTVLVSVPLARLEKDEPTPNWSRALSKEGWAIVNADRSNATGLLALRIAEYATEHDGVTLVAPCVTGYDTMMTRWGLYLNGGMNQVEWDAQVAECLATRDAHLGRLPEYLQTHPEVTVNILATEQEIYDYALRVKDQLGLSNMNVVPFFRG